MSKMKVAINKIKNENLEINTNNILNLFSYFSDISNIDNDLLIKMIIEYKNYKDYKATRLLSYVIKNNVFKEYNVEMAKLLYTWSRFSQGFIPIILYPKLINQITKYINDDVPISFISGTIIKFSIRSEKINKIHKLYNRDDIANILYSLKDQLSCLGVTSLSIYGSFSRNEAKVYSDVDIFIKTNEIKESYDDITKFLMSNLPISCDFSFNSFNEAFSIEPLNDLYKIF